MAKSENCAKHNEPIINVCVSPSCDLFKPLCKKCIPEHNQAVQSDNDEIHSKLKDYNEMKKEVSTTLDKSKKTLENLLEMGSKVIQLKNEKNLDGIFTEIDKIQAQINEIFQNFKSSIKKMFDDKLKEVDREILKLYEDIGKALDFCIKFSNKNLSLDSLKQLYLLDLDYQVYYKEETMKNLCQKKSETSLEAEFRKEYKDRFFVNFHTGLYELVDFGLNNSIRRSTILPFNLNCNKDDPFEIFPNINQIFGSLFSNWIFYFEGGKRNLFYIDVLKSKSKVYEKVTLNIQTPIFYKHRSILAQTGDIFLVGGYLENLNENNEESFKSIYKYDHVNRSLIPLAKMKTLRHSFGICAIKNKIFVVGGSNYREGALIKCEYYDIQHNQWFPFNFLNVKSMNHSIISFNDSYIYKFGGTRFNSNEQESNKMSLDLFERYDLKFDIWERIMLKENFIGILPSIAFFSGCYQINSNNILVFGGKNEKNEIQKQTYLINIPKTDNNNFNEKDEANFKIIELNTKSLNHPGYFTNFCPVVKDKNLFVLGNTSENEKKIFVFDSKQWRIYS